MEDKSLEDKLLGSSSSAQRAHTIHLDATEKRWNEETWWIGNPRAFRIFQPVQNTLIRPSSARCRSQGLAADTVHIGSKLSVRSLCRIMTTFWWKLKGFYRLIVLRDLLVCNESICFRKTKIYDLDSNLVATLSLQGQTTESRLNFDELLSNPFFCQSQFRILKK